MKHLFFILIFCIINNISSFTLEDNNLNLLKNNKNIYYLKIIEDFNSISNSYFYYLKRKFKTITNDSLAKVVIIEIDTPGGELHNAQKIVKLIKNLNYPTITFVNDSAYSAGAIISLASDYTVMVEGAKIGDIYPIILNNKFVSSIKDKKIYAKIMSGLSAMLSALAEKRQRRLLSQLKNSRYKHLKNSKVISNLKKIYVAMADPKIKLDLSKDGFQLKSGDILTLTSREAFKLGVIDGVYNNIDSILKGFGYTKNYNLITIEARFLDKLLFFLNNSIIISILLTVGILGIIIELFSGGWGLAGTIGIFSFSLFFYSQIVSGDASLSAIALFIIGLILLLLEFFVVPGFGIIGFAGFLSLFLAIVSALGFSFLSIEESKRSLLEIMLIIFSSLIISIIFFIMFWKYFPKSKKLSKMILKNVKINSISFSKRNKNLLGKKGKTFTVLRPSGTILIDGQYFNAMSNGSFIESNKLIKVISVDEAKIIVIDISKNLS